MANIPEYMRVRQYIVDMVISHQNLDERIMSERELSSELNVSRITTRRALKGLIDDGWLYVKRGKGMFINPEKCRNSAFSFQKFHKVMVVWGAGKHVNIDGFYMDIMENLCSVFKHLPIVLQTANLIGDKDQISDELMMYRPDGIIWVRPPKELDSVIALLRQKIPVCLIGSCPKQDEFAVTTDYHAAGKLASTWFLDRGYENTAFVGASEKSDIMSLIFKGWEDGFLSRGITFSHDLAVRETDNITEKISDLLHNGVDGIFSFAHLFSAVDSAMSHCNKKCPVIIDENYYGAYNARVQPSAKLVLSPPELATKAAQNIFQSLSEIDYASSEIVLQPQLKIVSRELLEEEK